MSETTTVSDETAGAEKKRVEKISRMYLDEKGGEIGARCTNDAHAVRITLVKSGYSLILNAKDLHPDVARAAALYGAANSITNTAGKKGLTDAEMQEAITDRYERIFDDATWAEGATGPRTSDLFEAVMQLYTSRDGQATEEWQAGMKRKLAEDEAFATSMKGRKDVLVIVEGLKLARQQARLQKAQASLTAEDEAPLDLSL